MIICLPHHEVLSNIRQPSKLEKHYPSNPPPPFSIHDCDKMKFPGCRYHMLREVLFKNLTKRKKKQQQCGRKVKSHQKDCYLYSTQCTALDLLLQWCRLCAECTNDEQRLMKDKWDVVEYDTRGNCFPERLQSTTVNR